jgi:hypothetical protein
MAAVDMYIAATHVATRRNLVHKQFVPGDTKELYPATLKTTL